MVDQRTEFEIALKDSISPGLRQIARQLKQINELARQGGEGGSGSVDKLRHSHVLLGGSARNALRDFTEMGSTILGFTKEVLGIGGALSTVKQISDSFADFAKGRVTLKMFSQDTKFAVQDISVMRRAMELMGVGANQADVYIKSLSNKLQELRAFKESSTLFQDLTKMGEKGSQLANQILSDTQRNDYKKAVQDILDFYKTQGPSQQFYLSQVLGVPQSVLGNLEENQRKVRAAFDGDEKAYTKYHENLVQFQHRVSDEWDRFADHAVTQINGFWSEMDEKAGNGHALSDWAIAEFDATVKAAQNTKGEWETIMDWFDRFTKFWGNTPDEGVQKQLDDLVKHKLNRTSAEEYQLEEEPKVAQGLLQNIRDSLNRMLGLGGTAGDGGGGGGGDGSAYGGGGATGGTGGPAQLNDESGKPIDADTMKQAEDLGRAGDVAGLQKLFAQKGYHMSGAACGIVATGYVRSAGFKPPSGSAIATSWHNWGEKGGAEDINKPGHPFGSMVATYFHRRYGGNPNDVLKPGQTGGHVMNIVPGTYDPKTGTAMFADQYGVKRRAVNDMDIRYAGDEAVAAAANKGQQRDKIDQSDNPTKGKADISFDFRNVPRGVKTEANASGMFDQVKVSRSAPATSDTLSRWGVN